MNLTQNDFDHTLKLAHLDVDPTNASAYLTQMQDILNHMSALDRLPLDDVEPSAYAHMQTHKKRQDIPQDFGDLQLDKNAPDWDGHSFKVPQMKAES